MNRFVQGHISDEIRLTHRGEKHGKGIEKAVKSWNKKEEREKQGSIYWEVPIPTPPPTPWERGKNISVVI
jgi:hypothetical protein